MPLVHIHLVEDTGLGIVRTGDVVLIQTGPHHRAEADHLPRTRRPSARRVRGGHDLIVSMVEDSTADWSFEDGTAQLVTGGL